MSFSRPRRRYVLALILAAASWGVATAISKRSLDDISPVVLLPIQLSMSVALLVLVMRISGQSIRRSIGDRRLGWLGILNPGLSYSLSLLGLVYISAGLSVLLWALEPLMILVLARWFLGERVSRQLVVLSLFAVVGMVLVIYQPDTDGRLIGVLLTVAGVACCAIYTVIARWLFGSADSTLGVVTIQQGYALGFAIVVLVAASLGNRTSWPTGVSVEAWASAIVSGLLYYATAYWLYLTALRRVPASLAAVSFYLIPVFGIAGGYILLAERFGPIQWIGVAVVLGAVAIIALRPVGAEQAREAMGR